MEIDKLLHTTTLCNIIIQLLNLKGLPKYNSLHKAYFWNIQVNQLTALTH